MKEPRLAEVEKLEQDFIASRYRTVFSTQVCLALMVLFFLCMGGCILGYGDP